MNKILATLCYIRKNGRTLMLHRIKKKNDLHEGKYNGLGGKLEDGETPEECVIREVYEESGLMIKNPLFKGMLTFPMFDGKNDWIVFVFIAKRFSGKMINSREGDLVWIENHKLLDLNLWEGDKKFLKYIDSDKIFSGKFIYINGKLKSYKMKLY
jgi:8-oxo-dGTP diphosphatase